ncbi:MAG: GDSL-type esterase/lipase family protein [Patescibacteria group bacterium]
MNISFSKRAFLLIFGALCVALGIVFNPLTVRIFFSFGGKLDMVDTVLVVLIEMALLGVGAAAIWFRQRIAKEMIRQNIFLLCVTVIMLLGLGEMGARAFDALQGGDFAHNQSRAERPIIPFRMFGQDLYEEKDGVRYIISRHGERYPFQKEPGTYRIVAMGGSTTQNFVGGTHYPKLLEEKLASEYPNKKIEVINIGNSGYSTAQMIILLTLDVISWQPDLVIASENINDLIANYFPHFVPDYANKYETSSFLPIPSVTSRVLGWSRLYWVLKSRGEALSYRLDDLHGDVYHRRSYTNEPPEEGQRVFRRNWETIARTAKARGVRLIIATQPLESSPEYWDRHMRYKTYNDITAYPLHDEFVAHHHRFNQIIREVARAEGIMLADNEAVFAGNQIYFTDLVHYTRVGIERLADEYATLIRSQKILN